MAEWREFAEFYTANFGRLTEADGLTEWAQFAKNEVRDMGALRDALKTHIARFTEALDRMEPPPRKPTLGQVRNAYYAELSRRKAARDRQIYGAGTTCGICRGYKWLVCLAPIAGNDEERQRWPADFRTTPWAQFRGIEMVRCPQCAASYPPELRSRIEWHALPMVIRPDHPDWPASLDPERKLQSIEGDQAILARIRENQ